MINIPSLAQRIQSKLPVLDERQRRLFLASEARKYCRDGVKRVSNLSGVSEKTIRRGLRELEEGVPMEQGRTRRPGGGRKLVEGDGEGINLLVSRMMEGEILSYTLLGRTSIVRKLESEYECKANTAAVERAFQNMWYKKCSASSFPTVSGRPPSVARQLEFIDSTAKAFQQSGDPVIFVDGQIRSLPRRLSENGEGNSIDLGEKSYGYLQRKLKGMVPGHAFSPRQFQLKGAYVKSSREYERFPGTLIDSIAGWWDLVGECAFPKSNQLFVVFDHQQESLIREDLWKYHLFQFAMAKEIMIYVSFLPRGRYRWRWRQEAHILYHVVCDKKNELMVDSVISTVIPCKVYSRLLERECHTISDIWWLYKITPDILDTVDIRKNGFCKNLNFSIHGFKKAAMNAILRAGKDAPGGQYDEGYTSVGTGTRKQKVRRIINHAIELAAMSVGRPLELILSLFEFEISRKDAEEEQHRMRISV